MSQNFAILPPILWGLQLTYGRCHPPHWTEDFLILLILPRRGGVDARFSAPLDLLLHHPARDPPLLLLAQLPHQQPALTTGVGRPGSPTTSPSGDNGW